MLKSKCCGVEPNWQYHFKIYTCPNCQNECETYVDSENKEVQKAKSTVKKFESDKYFDNETDPIKWIDLMIFKAYNCGSMGAKMPVEWARERMKNFINYHNRE